MLYDFLRISRWCSTITVAVTCGLTFLAHSAHAEPPRITPLGPDTPSLVVRTGERLGFSVIATDKERRLLGTEWYVDGHFLGAQYVSSIPDARDGAATFWRGINFSQEPGSRVTVSAIAFDKDGEYSDEAGRWEIQVEAPARALYVSGAQRIAASAQERAALLEHTAEQGITALVLYNIGGLVTGSTAQRQQLTTLIRQAHDAGVREVLAPVAGVSSLTAIANFSRERSARESFDGVITEYEFWNGASWATFRALLVSMGELREELGWSVSAYLGWFDDAQAMAMRDLVDRVFLHVYRGSPNAAFGAARERLVKLARAGWHRPLEVWPIFSTEEVGDAHERCDGDPDTKNYAGNWFARNRRTSGGALAAAEAIVREAFRDEPGTWRNGIRLAGFAYYRYRPLAAYLANGPASTWNRAPALCRASSCEPALAGPHRDCEFTVSVGEAHTFVADGWDEESNLSGVEWYGQGQAGVSYVGRGHDIVQYVREVAGTGQSATFERTYRFERPGTYTITALAFDRSGAYGRHLRWTVRVR